MLNDDQSVQRAKENIVVASSSKGKVKSTKKSKAKVSRPLQVERKELGSLKTCLNLNASLAIRKGTSR